MANAALADLIAKGKSFADKSGLTGIVGNAANAISKLNPLSVPAASKPTPVPAAKKPTPVPSAASAAVPVTDQAKAGGLYAGAKDPAQTAELARAKAVSVPAAAPASSYKDASGKVDFAKLNADMQSNLSRDELAGFQSQLVAAGNDAAKKAAAFDAITSAVNKKVADKAKEDVPTSTPAAMAESVASATDPEKLTQNRIASYTKLGSELRAASEAKRDDLVNIKNTEKATILNYLGLTPDLKPDLANADGLYSQFKKLYDDTLSARNEQFSNAAANVQANLNAQGRQQLIALGLSGKTDPGVIAMKMGTAGLEAMKTVNNAKTEYLNKVAETTKEKITTLGKILADGQITRETYDLAVASAKATARDEVNTANEKIMEKVFGAQEVANAYDATNRTDRINQIMKTMTNSGIDNRTAMSLLDVFNQRRDQTGALLTPERAVMMMAQWSKPEAAIPEDYKPKTASEKAAYAEYQKALKEGETALKAAAALKTELERLKVTKASSSTGAKAASQDIAARLTPITNMFGISASSLTRDEALDLVQKVDSAKKAKVGDKLEFLGETITLNDDQINRIGEVADTVTKLKF